MNLIGLNLEISNKFEKKINIFGLKVSVFTLIILALVLLYSIYKYRNMYNKIEDETDEVSINHHDTLEYKI